MLRALRIQNRKTQKDDIIYRASSFKRKLHYQWTKGSGTCTSYVSRRHHHFPYHLGDFRFHVVPNKPKCTSVAAMEKVWCSLEQCEIFLHALYFKISGSFTENFRKQKLISLCPGVRWRFRNDRWAKRKAERPPQGFPNGRIEFYRDSDASWSAIGELNTKPPSRSDMGKMSPLRDPDEYVLKIKYRPPGTSEETRRPVDEKCTGMDPEGRQASSWKIFNRWADTYATLLTKLHFISDESRSPFRMTRASWMMMVDNETNGSNAVARTAFWPSKWVLGVMRNSLSHCSGTQSATDFLE